MKRKIRARYWPSTQLAIQSDAGQKSLMATAPVEEESWVNHQMAQS